MWKRRGRRKKCQTKNNEESDKRTRKRGNERKLTLGKTGATSSGLAKDGGAGSADDNGLGVAEDGGDLNAS